MHSKIVPRCFTETQGGSLRIAHSIERKSPSHNRHMHNYDKMTTKRNLISDTYTQPSPFQTYKTRKKYTCERKQDLSRKMCNYVQSEMMHRKQAEPLCAPGRGRVPVLCLCQCYSASALSRSRKDLSSVSTVRAASSQFSCYSHLPLSLALPHRNESVRGCYWRRKPPNHRNSCDTVCSRLVLSVASLFMESSLGVKRRSSKLFSYDRNRSGLLKKFSSSFLATGNNYLMSPSVDWSAPSGKPTVHLPARISSCSGLETVRFPDSIRVSGLLCTHLWRCAGICRYQLCG